MTQKLNIDKINATSYFHIFNMMVYLTCIIGALISDAWLGKFKTVLYLSIVYCFGTLIMFVGTIPHFNIASIEFLGIALTLISIGNGAMRPCVSAFGGDQFILPAQAESMAKFFSLYYASFKAGVFISTVVTPALRENVHCFGDQDCYPLAFGVPAILLITAIGEFQLIIDNHTKI